MILKRKIRGVFLAVAGFMILGAEPVMAQERNRIDHVYLHIQSSIQSGVSGGEVEITPEGEAHYRVGNEEILNHDDDWIGGMTPRISFELYAENGYYFGGNSKSFFTFAGNDASLVTARREDQQTVMTVTIRLDRLENGDLTVNGAAWDGDDGTASWEENPNAKYYQVRLFRDENAVTGTRSVYDTYYEFGGNITRRGDYYFEVRAVGGGSEKGDWNSSDSWYVSAREADEISENYGDDTDEGWNGGPGVPAGSTGWGHHGRPAGPGAANGSSDGGPGWHGGISSQNGNHWCSDQRGKWYQYANGVCPVDCWELIDGTWYCFGQDGYLRCGWIEWGGKWYYTDSTGAMLINARTPDNCYVGGDGAWIP